jgi:CRP/FNR family transcriptional regulator, nitrogen fixation regulation protein
MLSQITTRDGSSNKTRMTIRTVPPAASHGLDGNIELTGSSMSFARNAEIYGEGEPADYLYKVISGSVRTYKILADGRRQIGAFYLPGDIFGLETENEHTFSAEAITDSKVLVVKRSTLVALAERDNDVARQLWALTADELRRVQDHILLLIKTAQERVVGFLLEMAERRSSGNAIELPMSRQDIADYLGLTIETVSRTITSLENAAAIEVPTSRRIVLRNRSALSRLNA